MKLARRTRHGVLFSMALAAASRTALAQRADAPSSSPGGVTLAFGPNVSIGDGPIGGAHVQLGIESSRDRRIAARLDGLAMLSLVAVADPVCISSPCWSYSDPYPTILYAGSLTLLTDIRPRLYVATGVGAYHGSGNKSTSERYGSAAGFSVGIGQRPSAADGRRLSAEARYHYLPGGLGKLSGFFTGSVSIRIH